MQTTAKQPQRHAKQKHTTIKKDTWSQVDAKLLQTYLRRPHKNHKENALCLFQSWGVAPIKKGFWAS